MHERDISTTDHSATFHFLAFFSAVGVDFIYLIVSHCSLHDSLVHSTLMGVNTFMFPFFFIHRPFITEVCQAVHSTAQVLLAQVVHGCQWKLLESGALMKVAMVELLRTYVSPAASRHLLSFFIFILAPHVQQKLVFFLWFSGESGVTGPCVLCVSFCDKHGMWSVKKIRL